MRSEQQQRQTRKYGFNKDASETSREADVTHNIYKTLVGCVFYKKKSPHTKKPAFHFERRHGMRLFHAFSGFGRERKRLVSLGNTIERGRFKNTTSRGRFWIVMDGREKSEQKDKPSFGKPFTPSTAVPKECWEALDVALRKTEDIAFAREILNASGESYVTKTLSRVSTSAVFV